MSRLENVDLDDTGNCPLEPACRTCGTSEGLAVATAQTVVGVYCLTTCPGCAAERMSVSPVKAVKLSLEHCAHLGIDADEMAAAMRRSESAGRVYE